MKNIFLIVLLSAVCFPISASAYHCKYYQWPDRNCLLENEMRFQETTAQNTSERSEQSVQVDLKDIHFDFDEATLSNKAKRELNKTAKKYQNINATNLQIAGHTDSVGEERYNQALSEKRAEAVRDYLISKGIDEDKVHITALGERSPVAPNTTEEGREKNRRADVIVNSRAIIAKSGTILHLAALACTPAVMVYEVSRTQAWIAQNLLNFHFPYYGFPNLIANHLVVPEMVGELFDSHKISVALSHILYDGDERAKMLNGLREVRNKIACENSLDNAVNIILQL